MACHTGQLARPRQSTPADSTHMRASAVYCFTLGSPRPGDSPLKRVHNGTGHYTRRCLEQRVFARTQHKLNSGRQREGKGCRGQVLGANLTPGCSVYSELAALQDFAKRGESCALSDARLERHPLPFVGAQHRYPSLHLGSILSLKQSAASRRQTNCPSCSRRSSNESYWSGKATRQPLLSAPSRGCSLPFATECSPSPAEGPCRLRPPSPEKV